MILHSHPKKYTDNAADTATHTHTHMIYVCGYTHIMIHTYDIGAYRIRLHTHTYDRYGYTHTLQIRLHTHTYDVHTRTHI